MVCTAIILFSMSVNGGPWVKSHEFKSTKDALKILSQMTDQEFLESRKVKLKNVKVIINESAPFDCEKGPPQ